MLKNSKQTGFTLMEMLIVITIMVALIAFAAPDIAGMFRSSEINRAAHLIEKAMLEARSEAIRLNTNTAVIFSYRTLDAQADAKVWVLRGSGVDKDVAGSPLQGLTLDEMDIVANAPGDDVIMLTTYTLPPSIFLHGLCYKRGTIDSPAAGERGDFTRWYAVFNPEGTCFMVKPDGDSGEAPTSSSLNSWKNVNDYLPDTYEIGSSPIGDVADVNISSEKATETEFEDDPHLNHDLKVYSEEEEIYLHLQENMGRFYHKRIVE